MEFPKLPPKGADREPRSRRPEELLGRQRRYEGAGPDRSGASHALRPRPEAHFRTSTSKRPQRPRAGERRYLLKLTSQLPQIGLTWAASASPTLHLEGCWRMGMGLAVGPFPVLPQPCGWGSTSFSREPVPFGMTDHRSRPGSGARANIREPPLGSRAVRRNPRVCFRSTSNSGHQRSGPRRGKVPFPLPRGQEPSPQRTRTQRQSRARGSCHRSK